MGVPDVESDITKVQEARSDREGEEGVGDVLGYDEVTQKYGRTKRGLSGRHVQLMAIGGSIGSK